MASQYFVEMFFKVDYLVQNNVLYWLGRDYWPFLARGNTLMIYICITPAFLNPGTGPLGPVSVTGLTVFVIGTKCIFFNSVVLIPLTGPHILVNNCQHKTG